MVEANKPAAEEAKTQSAEESKLAPKFDALQNEKGETVEVLENKYTKNITSPFIAQQKAWDDDNIFQIPPEIIRGITEELGFIKPSNI